MTSDEMQPPAREDEDAADAADAALARKLSELLDEGDTGIGLDSGRLLNEHPELAPLVERMLDHLSDDDMPGAEPGQTLVLGGCRVIREIGRGGMGVVYEAWQPSLDRRVALKTLPTSLVDDPKAVARFDREAKAAARLHHPSIVGIHSTGIENATPYIVMEHVEGQTLRQLGRRTLSAEDPSGETTIAEWEARPAFKALSMSLASGTPLELEVPAPDGDTEGAEARASGEAVFSSRGEEHAPGFRRIARAFASVAEGLHHAHSLGVIHRDLKPSNFVLDGQGTLRILDFGLAWIEGQEPLTLSEESVGTPLYMSPEQLQKDATSVGPGTDIYSFGVTLYEVLAGRPPLEGRTLPQTMHLIVQRDPPRLREVNPAVPLELESIVLKCLRKRPRERYATAEALAQDLRRFARGDPVEARSYSRWERLLYRTWKHRGRVSLVAVLAALVVVVGVLGWGRWQERLARACARYEARVAQSASRLQRGLLEKVWRSRGPVEGRYEGGYFLPEGSGFTDPADFQDAVWDSGPDTLRSAMSELSAAARDMPNRPEAHYHRARCFAVLGQNDQALAELDAALLRDSEFLPAIVLRVVVLERAGRPEDAEADRNRIARTTERWARHWLEAQRALLLPDWSAAETAFAALIDSLGLGREPFPGCYAEAVLGHGIACLKQNALEDAVENFARAEGFIRRHPEPGLLLGRAYLLAGNTAQAEKTFGRLHAQADEGDTIACEVAGILASCGDIAGAYRWAGKIRDEFLRATTEAPLLIHLGRVDGAIAAARKAARLRSSEALPYLWWGLGLLVGSDTVAEAMDVLERARERDPRNPMVHVWIGDALAKEGELKRALESYRHAARLDPENSWAHVSAGVTLERLGELRPAFEEYVAAFERGPYVTAVYQHLDGVLRREGFRPDPARVDRLVAAMERVLGTGADHPLLPDLLRILSLTLSESGEKERTAKAIRYATVAVDRTEGENPRMLVALADAHLAAADPAAALPILEKAVTCPHVSRLALDKLAACRRSLRPDILSFASVDAWLEDADTEVILPEGAEWHFFRGTTEPSSGTTAWTEKGFDVAAWEHGPSGFGYADGDDRTELSDMKGNYSTVYIRTSFTVDDPSGGATYTLSVRGDDGFVVFLNGSEIWRQGVPPGDGPVPATALSSVTVSVEPPSPVEIPLATDILVEGTNILALQGLNASVTSSDLTLLPVLRSQRPPDRERDGRILAVFRSFAGARPVLFAFLEGRVLERRGKQEEALGRFEVAALGAAGRPEPVLAIARVLRGLGRCREAEVMLRTALEGELSGTRALWEAWLEVAFRDLEWEPSFLLSRFPAASEAGRRPRIARDVEWLLERLADGEPVRVNCGGAEYRSSTPPAWGRDAFFRHGCRFSETAWLPLPPDAAPAIGEEIAGTDDDLLYQTERWYPTEEVGPAGYRVPLPTGRYDVILHFAEIFHRRLGSRTFDVFLEGQRVASWYEPLRAGFATKVSRSFPVEVRDGFLDLELVPQAEYPKISAIEIWAAARQTPSRE